MSPAYYIRDGYLSEDLVRIKLIRGVTQFQFTIASADIQHTSLGKQFLALIKGYLSLERHDVDAYMKPLNLMFEYFLPLLLELAPTVSVQGLSIESFVYAPTYKMEVLGKQGGDGVGITGRSSLHSPGVKDKTSLHAKWEKQVRDAVRILHENDIVWGDVNPCNVIVDEGMNAWVIDFGGRNNAKSVDDDKAETKEGDWQGVERLFGEWLSGGGGLEE